ncbi:MAG TPA: amidohydrolase [Kofleriaceae bacterium]|nr:amidohydrolase [Kofleriaceae bacterium]
MRTRRAARWTAWTAWAGALALVAACGAGAGTGAGAQARAGGEAAQATLVLVGGDVHTNDPARPRAQAVAVRGNRIVEVGDDAAVRALVGPDTRVVELAGRTVTAGLVDGHCHLYGLGSMNDKVALKGATSEADAVARTVAWARSRGAGEWIEGRGWDQNRWGGAFPTRASLDAAIGDRPVVLTRVDGHAIWVNGAALAAAGINRNSKDPAGGRIVRDAHGEPTGVLVDNAADLVTAKIPPASAAVRERRIRAAAAEAIATGLTGVHEMGLDDATIAVYRDLEKRGELPLRVDAYLLATPEVLAGLKERELDPDDGDAYFSLVGVKLFADGALGSRGAALAADYSDDPGNRGLWVTPPDELERDVAIAAGAGWQVATHAIGDAATHATVDAYEAAIAASPGSDLRLRVEHAQVMMEDDIPRMGRLKIIASMQPTHATSDMPWAEARLGPERIKGAYAWRKMLDAGVLVVAGSDFPVEETSPTFGLYAAVTRQDPDGKPDGGWYPDQRMTLDEAVYAFSAAPAIAVFAEEHRGWVRPGMVADLTVFDRPLVGGHELVESQAAMTIVGGEVVFERGAAK